MNPARSPRFVLGDGDGDRLELEVMARHRPDETNWLTARVTVVAQPWRGSYRADFRAEELARFREALHRLYDDPSVTEAGFKALEPWLDFVVRRTDSLGHLEVRGRARQSFLEDHNVLHFVLDLDQTYIQPALNGLEDILREFPVLASADE